MFYDPMKAGFAFIMRTVVDALDVSPVKDIGTIALTLKLLVVEVVLWSGEPFLMTMYCS